MSVDEVPGWGTRVCRADDLSSGRWLLIGRDFPAEPSDSCGIWFERDRIDLAVSALTSMPYRVVDCIPVEAKHLATSYFDEGCKQGMLPASTREEFVVGVFGDAGHQAGLTLVMAPCFERSRTLLGLFQWKVEPASDVAWTGNVLAAELRVRVVSVLAVVSEICQAIDGRAVQANEVVQRYCVAEHHATAIHGQVSEVDWVRRVFVWPRRFELDFEDSNSRYIEVRRLVCPCAYGQLPVRGSRRDDGFAAPVVEMSSALGRGCGGALRQSLTELRPVVDPAGHTENQCARRRGDVAQFEDPVHGAILHVGCSWPLRAGVGDCLWIFIGSRSRRYGGYRRFVRISGRTADSSRRQVNRVWRAPQPYQRSPYEPNALET